jgi:hypothetical protein
MDIFYLFLYRFSSNIIEDNYKLKLCMRNITDHRTGRWDLYAVSSIYEVKSPILIISFYFSSVTDNSVEEQFGPKFWCRIFPSKMGSFLGSKEDI